MELLYERCAALDVHKKNVKVCFVSPLANGQAKKETRTYPTMTQNLLEMRDWLKEQGCTHLAMEATGVYWKPIYNLLEGDFTVLVVNAHHIQGGSRAQDRRQGCRMDCRFAATWPVARQFHSLRPSTRAAGPYPIPHSIGGGTRP